MKINTIALINALILKTPADRRKVEHKSFLTLFSCGNVANMETEIPMFYFVFF